MEEVLAFINSHMTPNALYGQLEYSSQILFIYSFHFKHGILNDVKAPAVKRSKKA
jgi:hypothetical protein